MTDTPEKNPFDFNSIIKADEIFGVRMRLGRSKLDADKVRQDKIEDLFFDAIEAPGVAGSIRQEAINTLDAMKAKQCRDFMAKIFKMGADADSVWQRLNRMNDVNRKEGERMISAFAFGLSQQAVRIAKSKGEEADVFLREIAKGIEALSLEERDSAVFRLEVMIKAHARAVTPLFDFSNAKDAAEISIRAATVLRSLYVQGVSEENAVDLFYEALEALDGELKQQVLEGYATDTDKLLKRLAVNFSTAAAYEPTAWDFMMRARAAAQHAVHLSRLKGASTARLTQEVADEMSALSEAQRQSLLHMKPALENAYKRSITP